MNIYFKICTLAILATKRKYDPGYSKYGFTSIKKKNTDLPQCVICAEVLEESLCCLAKLKRHISTKHGNLSAKNEDCFKSREAELKKRRLDISVLFGQFSCSKKERSHN